MSCNEEILGNAILFAEDDSMARSTLISLSTRQFPGITLLGAENGKVGLDLYREHRPEIVITDINMPVMDGFRMAREIKALNPDVTIIAMSAHNEEDYHSTANEVGISHYLLKPIEFKKLFAILNGCLNEIPPGRTNP